MPHSLRRHHCRAAPSPGAGCAVAFGVALALHLPPGSAMALPKCWLRNSPRCGFLGPAQNRDALESWLRLSVVRRREGVKLLLALGVRDATRTHAIDRGPVRALPTLSTATRRSGATTVTPCTNPSKITRRAPGSLSRICSNCSRRQEADRALPAVGVVSAHGPAAGAAKGWRTSACRTYILTRWGATALAPWPSPRSARAGRWKSSIRRSGVRSSRCIPLRQLANSVRSWR